MVRNIHTIIIGLMLGLVFSCDNPNLVLPQETSKEDVGLSSFEPVKKAERDIRTFSGLEDRGQDGRKYWEWNVVKFFSGAFSKASKGSKAFKFSEKANSAVLDTGEMIWEGGRNNYDFLIYPGRAAYRAIGALKVISPSLQGCLSEAEKIEDEVYRAVQGNKSSGGSGNDESATKTINPKILQLFVHSEKSFLSFKNQSPYAMAQRAHVVAEAGVQEFNNSTDTAEEKRKKLNSCYIQASGLLGVALKEVYQHLAL